LPERERERVRRAYWQALDDAIGERDGKQRLQTLVDELDNAGYTAAAKCLADDLGALVVHLRYPTTHRRRWRSTDEIVKHPIRLRRQFRRWIGPVGASEGRRSAPVGSFSVGGAGSADFGVGRPSSPKRRAQRWSCRRR